MILRSAIVSACFAYVVFYVYNRIIPSSHHNHNFTDHFIVLFRGKHVQEGWLMRTGGRERTLKGRVGDSKGTRNGREWDIEKIKEKVGDREGKRESGG